MIIIPAILEGVATRKDKTYRLTFGTNEITSQNGSELLAFNGTFCYLALKPDQFKTQEIESLNNLKAEFEDKGKTQSQRIRNCLFKLWEQTNEGFTNFAEYYQNKTEKYIEHLKGKME